MIFSAVGDTPYNIVLLLHVLTALVAMAPIFVLPLLPGQMRPVTMPEQQRILVTMIVNTRTVYAPALILTGVLGFALSGMSNKTHSLTEGWLIIAAATWVIMNGVLHAVILPALKTMDAEHLDESAAEELIATTAEHLEESAAEQLIESAAKHLDTTAAGHVAEHLIAYASEHSETADENPSKTATEHPSKTATGKNPPKAAATKHTTTAAAAYPPLPATEHMIESATAKQMAERLIASAAEQPEHTERPKNPKLPIHPKLPKLPKQPKPPETAAKHVAQRLIGSAANQSITSAVEHPDTAATEHLDTTAAQNIETTAAETMVASTTRRLQKGSAIMTVLLIVELWLMIWQPNLF